MNRWKPSLEGSLAIFNVLSLLAFAVMAQAVRGTPWLLPYETAIKIWLWILSLPIALFCFFLLSQGGGTGSAFDIVLLCVSAGVNGIAWGHGVAWILRRTLLSRFVAAADDGDESPAAPDDHPPPAPSS